MNLLARLRNPKPVDVVEVTITGHPEAVTNLARALAAVAVVTSMRHHVQGHAAIRIDVTCHRPVGTETI